MGGLAAKEAGEPPHWRYRQELVKVRADAVVLRLFDDALSVEVGEALAADLPGVDVLVRVDEGIDAPLAKLCDERVDALEVVEVVHSLLALNRLPHDAKPHKVDAPSGEVFHVLLGEGGVAVELVGVRQVGWHFVDDVDAVKKQVPAKAVLEALVVDVDMLVLPGR